MVITLTAMDFVSRTKLSRFRSSQIGAGENTLERMITVYTYIHTPGQINDQDCIFIAVSFQNMLREREGERRGGCLLPIYFEIYDFSMGTRVSREGGCVCV